jgi:hypothetical protein
VASSIIPTIKAIPAGSLIPASPLFDQVYGSRPRRPRRLLDGVSLERRQAARDAEDDLWPRETAVDGSTHEVCEHLLRNVEIREHAVTERSQRADPPGGATDHALRVCSHREGLAAAFGERDHRGLEHHDSSSPREDDRVCRAKVNGQIPGGRCGIIPECQRGVGRSRPSGAAEKL